MEAPQWQAVLKELRSRVGTQPFEAWFSRLKLKAIEQDDFIVEAPSDFAREWISREYMDLVCEAIEAAYDSAKPQVRLVTAPSEPSMVWPRGPGGPDESHALLARLNPQYTFENFVVGPSNRLSHAAALAVVDNPGCSYNPLFVHGSVGLGKTHLIQAVCRALLQRSSMLKILCLSCEGFVNDYIKTIKDGAWEAFRYKYRTVDVLLIDDIQFLSYSEHTQEEFFHTFNALYNAQKQLLVTSDVAPQELPSIQERLLSRFKWGLVARIEAPAYETRVAIVERKAAAQNTQLPADAVQVLASSVTTNVRELQGAVTRVIAYSRVAQRTPSADLARQALRESLPERKPISVDDIITLVADRFNVRVSDLQSRKKSRSIAFPRQICMHLAREFTKHSLEEIGGYFGGRDHTTVLHAHTKISRQRQEDQSLQLMLEKLRAEIQTH